MKSFEKLSFMVYTFRYNYILLNKKYFFYCLHIINEVRHIIASLLSSIAYQIYSLPDL